MAQMIPIMMIASAAMSAGGTIAAGNNAKASADAQARQLKQQANAAEAEGTYRAEQDAREAKIMESRAQAVAAASGAGASDKTVLDIMGRIQKEGEFRALADLYVGSNQGALYRADAANTRTEGKNAQEQSYLAAVGGAMKSYAWYKSGTMMDQTSSMYRKYAQDYEINRRVGNASNDPLNSGIF